MIVVVMRTKELVHGCYPLMNDVKNTRRAVHSIVLQKYGNIRFDNCASYETYQEPLFY